MLATTIVGNPKRLRRQEFCDPEALGIGRGDEKDASDSLGVIARCLHSSQGAERMGGDENGARGSGNFAANAAGPGGEMRVVPVPLTDANGSPQRGARARFANASARST